VRESICGLGFASLESVTRRLTGVLAIAALGGLVGCTDGPSRWPEVPTLHPNGDLLAVNEVLLISDSVQGDVMLAGRTLEFDGFSGGSYLGGAGDQTVAGRVEGSVRAAGGTVELQASVGRNVTLAGGSIMVRDEAEVEGNAYLAGGSVRLDGAVSGDVYVGAGDVVLDGDVGGDVRVESGALRIGPDARIDGELRYRLSEGAAPVVSTEAVVAGGLVGLEPRADEGGDLGFFVLRLLAFVLCSAVVVALFPGTLAATEEKMRSRPAAALGYGLLFVILVPLAVAIFAVTLVGIPLAVIVAMVYGLSLYLAPIVPALWVGDEMLKGREPSDRKSAVLLVATGGAVVGFAILLPWIGLLARVLATCAGLGAVVLAIQSRRLSTPSGQPR
jgi:cytoskeletal protein CcmA (bactofilin family)